jgi:hypothetical protein
LGFIKGGFLFYPKKPGFPQVFHKFFKEQKSKKEKKRKEIAVLMSKTAKIYDYSGDPPSLT